MDDDDDDHQKLASRFANQKAGQVQNDDDRSILQVATEIIGSG